MSAAPLETAPEYRLLSMLGSGAYAHVVVARRMSDGQQVALKVLRPGAEPDVVERFRDEAAIMQAIDHPGVVKAHRLLDHNGQLVLELEYVHGVTLEALAGEQPVPPRAALGIIQKAAEALHAAYHGPFGPDGAPLRVVHRDLKPPNLMLTQRGAVKILDFGVAKAQLPDRSAHSLVNVWGSVGYDAPERREEGREITSAADVYALGVTLFVLLTGRPMVVSQKPEQHDDEVANTCARAAEKLDLPMPVMDLIKRMMRHDPHVRPRMSDLGTLTANLAASLEGPELEPYADDLVGRLLVKRQVPRARDHQHYDDVRFLEEAPVGGTDLTGDQALEALREALAQEGWEARRAELRPLVGKAGPAGEALLVQVIQRAEVPWWMFWAKAARPEELEAALQLLAAGSGAAPPEVKELTRHSDPRVARAARFLMGKGSR